MQAQGLDTQSCSLNPQAGRVCQSMQKRLELGISGIWLSRPLPGNGHCPFLPPLPPGAPLSDRCSSVRGGAKCDGTTGRLRPWQLRGAERRADRWGQACPPLRRQTQAWGQSAATASLSQSLSLWAELPIPPHTHLGGGDPPLTQSHHPGTCQTPGGPRC